MNPMNHVTIRHRSMFRPLRGLVLLLAWLCATGMHWDLVQIAAWSRMWYRAAQTETVASALDSTFAPGATCRLCAAVDEGRTTGDLASDSLLRLVGRPVLLAWADEPRCDVRFDAEAHQRVWSTGRTGLTRAEPPAPPPRFARV
ncbi:MAG TPA: hypothetical protein VGD88_01910 [Opitutaceae bacterium]